jgi:quercetin dioxygenase-like cupin family protein
MSASSPATGQIDNPVYYLDNQVVYFARAQQEESQMSVRSPAEYRTTETPNAVMTTLASPTQGTSGLSLWRVTMKDGAQGPLHIFDSEQIWTALSGTASIELEAGAVDLIAGGTVVLPAGATRRITARKDFAAIVAGYGAAKVTVVGEDDDRGTPAWIS